MFEKRHFDPNKRYKVDKGKALVAGAIATAALVKGYNALGQRPDPTSNAPRVERTVEQGDTPWSIARHNAQPGSEIRDNVKIIMESQTGSNPDLLEIGEKVSIPLEPGSPAIKELQKQQNPNQTQGE